MIIVQLKTNIHRLLTKNRTEQNKEEQNKTKQNKTKQNKTKKIKLTIQCNIRAEFGRCFVATVFVARGFKKSRLALHN